MIYRVEKVLRYSLVAHVDAESIEEAIIKAENGEVESDWENVTDFEDVECAYVGECFNEDGDPAMSYDEVDDSEVGDEISSTEYFKIAES